MARIAGVEPERAGLFVRFVYWMVWRKLGRAVLPYQNHCASPAPVAVDGRNGGRANGRPIRGYQPQIIGFGQSGHAHWLPFLNRHRFCREQKTGSDRGKADGIGRFRIERGVQRP